MTSTTKISVNKEKENFVLSALAASDQIFGHIPTKKEFYFALAQLGLIPDKDFLSRVNSVYPEIQL